ncbi:MAG: rhodanese-like domain-containing protein [Thermodesulfobacteriota bacterium]|jgi:rhodanese-related sulfurtransferase
MKKQWMPRLLTLMICCVFFLLPANVVAAEEKFKTITTTELKQKMDAHAPLTLIDALSAIEHNELAIVGSINIPSSKVTTDHPLMPADKASLLIFYCKGPKCSKSKEAAERAIALGYTNVMVYNDGLPDWAKNGYPVETHVDYPKTELPRLTPQEMQAQAASAVLLDIRGDEVKDVGRIKDAVSIPLDDMDEKFGTLPKGKKIIIFDHAGKQVSICGKFLTMKGYTDLAVMDGGILAWKRAGLPTE